MFDKNKIDNYGDVLTPQDVKEVLGIGLNKTYELLKSGAIKNFKIGRCRKIPKHCLIEYIDSMVFSSDSNNTYHKKGELNDDNDSKN